MFIEKLKKHFAEIQEILSAKAIRLNNAVSDTDVHVSYEERGF